MRVGGYYTPIRNKFVQVQIHVNFLSDLLILCHYFNPQPVESISIILRVAY